MVKNYYEILGLKKDASKEEIRNAYLKLSKIYHPDINEQADSEEKFREINEAYSFLYEDKKRGEYDDYYEGAVEAEKEFKEKIKPVDLFTRYIHLMQKYRPARKVNYEIRIDQIFSYIIEATILDSKTEDKRIKSGAFVSIRSKGILPEGGSLSEFSATGIIFLVRGDKISVEIIDMKKAKLIAKNRAKLKLEEDVRFLFDNIDRHIDLIMTNPYKYQNFRRVLTDIYTEGQLGLSEIGIYEPEGKREVDFLFQTLNDQQKELIKKSIEVFENPNGYIVTATGPGGTGKTETIVEIIRQLINIKKDIKILVTSFTNVAVDNVFSMLLKKDSSLKGNIIRVAFEQRVKLKEVKEVCLAKKKNSKEESKLDLIKKHNVIGATLDKLGTALFDGFEFDFAILDECSMIEFSKIMLAATKTKKMFMIGDAKQLNPFIDGNVKRYLKKNGFTSEDINHVERSFFIDLVEYLENTKSSALIKLICQHRCYEEIIKFPNEMFYGNILKTKISRYQLEKYNFLSKIEFENNFIKDVINPKNKLVWVDLANLPLDIRYSSNKDWAKRYGTRDLRYFHIAQAAITILILKKYLNELYYEYKKDLEYRSKIGIISPFNDQVELIRKYFYENPIIDPYMRNKLATEKNIVDKALIKLETYMFITNLEAGTVHKFQGREKDIIIFDITSYTGVGAPQLLKDFKVLNVAITRAKCKFIIIGAIREDLNYYSDLYNEKYSYIIGAKKPENASKDKTKELLMKINGYNKNDYVGGFQDKDISEYFDEDNKLKSEFYKLIEELSEIEKQITSGDITYSPLSEEEEYNRKLEEIYKIIDLKLIKDSLLNSLKDKELQEEAKKLFRLLDEYVKNQFSNLGMYQKTLNIIRGQLNVFLEKDAEDLLKKIVEINKIEFIDKKIEEYQKIIRETKSETIVNYIASINQQKLKKRLKHIRYKKKLEKLLKTNLDGYFNIISLSIGSKKKEELIAKIDGMPKSLFVPYGRDLCKTIIANGTFKANHPRDWFISVLRPPIKEGWDLDLWLCLRANYDKRFGREDI